MVLLANEWFVVTEIFITRSSVSTLSLYKFLTFEVAAGRTGNSNYAVWDNRVAAAATGTSVVKELVQWTAVPELSSIFWN